MSKVKEVSKVFAIIFTDKWQVDKLTLEIWSTKQLATARAAELDTVKGYDKQANFDEHGNKYYWYEVVEFELLGCIDE